MGDPTFHWSIDLGGVITLIVTVVGFIALIARSRTDLENLKASVKTMAEDLDEMKIKLARLEERVSNWVVARMHNPKN